MHWCDHVICDVTLLRTLKINEFILYLYYQRYLASCLFNDFFSFCLKLWFYQYLLSTSILVFIVEQIHKNQMSIKINNMTIICH